MSQGAGRNVAEWRMRGSAAPTVGPVTDAKGNTWLHIAVYFGHIEVVRGVLPLLLHPLIDAQNNAGYSPLIMSCCVGHLDFVKVLVAAGANLCIASLNGDTALMSAVRAYHPEIVQFLIAAGANVNINGRSPLLSACSSGQLAIVKMLITAGARLRIQDKNGDTCLMAAARAGHTETVRYLAGQPGVDVDHKCNKGFTALHHAVRKNHPLVVKELIDAGADIEACNRRGCSPLWFAANAGLVNIVDIIARAGAEQTLLSPTNMVTTTPLIFAVQAKHFDNVHLSTADVNEADGNGNTALHYALEARQTDVVQILIDAGADIDTQDAQGRSPLLRASYAGDLDIVKVLVTAGAQLSVTDVNNDTCLILASQAGHAGIVGYLAALPQVNVFHQGRNGRTALSYIQALTPRKIRRRVVRAYEKALMRSWQ